MTQDNWSNLVEHSDDCTVYHLLQWGTLLEEVHGHKLVYLEKDNGVFPLACIRSRIFGNRLISLPFADYGGPYARDRETAEELVTDCQRKARELGVDFIEVRCPGSQYFDILADDGFIRRDDYLTFVLQLKGDIEHLWKNIGEKKKKKVRKARRNGTHTVEARDKSSLKTFYTLYLKTMKRLGSPPQPYRFFEKMWDLLYPGNMNLFLVKHENDYIAGKLVFLHNDTIYQAYSPSLSEYYSLAPNDLVQWDLIQWGNDHDYRQLHFGRTRKNEGPETFKQQWGGEAVDMPYYYQFLNRELKERQEVRYHRAAELWSKYMPECIANCVGPRIIKQIG